MSRPTASKATVLNCLREYANYSSRKEYWIGLYNRITHGAPLNEGDGRAVNDLVRDLTDLHHYNYFTTILL